jgi:sec-independent protein translocase protein TatA
MEIGPAELILVLAVVVMIFGASRIADIGGALGKGIREFRTNLKDDAEESPAPALPLPSFDTAAATVSAVKCTSCGSLNGAGAKFCGECATALN